MGRDQAVVGGEAGRRRGLLHLALWCSSSGGGEERGGGVHLRERIRIPVLPEEVEACAVFPLGAGHADAGRRNPAPLDSAVGGPYESD